MSKVIKLTEEQLEECRRDFDIALNTTKLCDGKVSFSKTISCPKAEATLYFDPLAWRKMQKLIKEFNKEIAWHGVAYRGDNGDNHEYYISDILVYPQKVTGATVNTDQEKYQDWLYSHDDEVFNNIRMQGHSHVNMGVTPSSVDETHQAKILDQLEDDMFYIFLIWNKSNSKFIKIYDLAKNILFETNDVTVKILDDGSGIDEFLENAKEMVDETTVQYSGAYSGHGYNYGYNTTQNFADKKEENKNTTSNSVVALKDVKDAIAAVEDDKKKDNNQYGKNGKRKGNRKKKDIVNPGNACTEGVNIQPSIFDDDYSPYGYVNGKFYW